MSYGSKMLQEWFHLLQNVIFKTRLIFLYLCSDINVILNHIILTTPVWAELMHLIYVPVCILVCVFLFLSDVCGSPEDHITVLLYVALGIVRSSNIWRQPKYNFSHTCNFANHQTWADRLWEQEHMHGAECIDYSCCSSWALLILMWPQTVNR